MRLAGLLLLLACGTAQAQLELEKPTGGWNYSGLTDGSDEVRFAYPTPPIDRGGQKHRTLILGNIRDAAKMRVPPTLVVNGNPMPLYAGKDGAFARPWAFGAGSNGVEVRLPQGQRKRVQFYEANAGRPQAQLRMVLTWDDPQAEVDLHVITPDGQHAFWAQPVLSGGGGFDVDSVDGAGPEIFSVAAPVRGTYRVYVNYWGNFGASGYHFDEGTRQRDVITARVTLIAHENSVKERRESFVVPLRKIGDLNLVKAFIH
jgi:uncharacterized protein YfaP (DUF2135 family)